MLLIIKDSNYSGLSLLSCMVDYFKYIDKKRIVKRRKKKQKDKYLQELIEKVLGLI